MTPSTGSSGGPAMENQNPTLYKRAADREITPEELDDSVVDPFDAREIFDIIRSINDPEHPLSLEELNVVEERLCLVDDQENTVDITFTPTIPHCSMATLIGLCIRVKLLHALPARFKVTVKISPGAHVSEAAINKQLADKERVAAALENSHLTKVINECIFASTPTISKLTKPDINCEPAFWSNLFPQEVK